MVEIGKTFNPDQKPISHQGRKRIYVPKEKLEAIRDPEEAKVTKDNEYNTNTDNAVTNKVDFDIETDCFNLDVNIPMPRLPKFVTDKSQMREIEVQTDLGMFDMGRVGSGDVELKPPELAVKEKMNDGDAANNASQSGLTDNDFDTIGLFVDQKLKSYLREN